MGQTQSAHRVCDGHGEDSSGIAAVLAPPTPPAPPPCRCGQGPQGQGQSKRSASSLNCLGTDCFSSPAPERNLDPQRTECDCERPDFVENSTVDGRTVMAERTEEDKNDECAKSSSIHQYISAFSDRTDADQADAAARVAVVESATAPVPAAKPASGAVVKPKKKQWVPKFCTSRSKTAKVSVDGSGAEAVGSSGDASCVCTMYRKTEGGSARGGEPIPLPLPLSRSASEFARSDSSEFDLDVLNLPFNVTVARVALGEHEGVYGTVRDAARRAGSAGLCGQLRGSTVYGALFARDGDGEGGPAREGNVVLLSVRRAPAARAIDLSGLPGPADDSHSEDCDERARARRAREIAEGVEPPPGYRPRVRVVSPEELTALLFHQERLAERQSAVARVHTQVDYIHCLIPDLRAITGCAFYWGKMDRYEAERLLEGKPEGTFLLRDSAHEDHLFSVSFRKYERSLHARIEQFNHKFSFDARDPGVYASDTVTGLIEHYKDDACLMFFEPMLTRPLPRTFTFSLQHLCRSVIASNITYDGINRLKLPNPLKTYLKEYHYRQRVRVKRFEDVYDCGPPEGVR